MKSLISIIVPVFNREKYLERCLDSLTNQTYKNLEIIIIDDGSIDNSLKICKSYEDKDSRIRVFSVKNSGVSAARNLGILKSRGEYIQFVDSDDYIELNMCEYMINKLIEDDSDLIICGYNNIVNDKIIPNNCINRTVNNLEELKEEFSFLYKMSFFHAPWNKIFRKNIIKFLYNESLEYGEDVLFNLQNMKNVKGITLIDNCFYNYVNGTIGSLLNKERDNTFKIATLIYKNANELCDCSNIDYKYRKGIGFVFINYTIVELNYKLVKLNLKKQLGIAEIKKYINNKEICKEIKDYETKKMFNKIIGKLIELKCYNLIYYLFKIKRLAIILIKNKKIFNYRLLNN